MRVGHLKKILLLSIFVGLGLIVSFSIYDNDALAITSVVARWTFNGGNNMTAHDVSGNGNNGRIIGATVLDPPHCKTSYCLSFDGIDDVVKVPNSSTLNFGSNGNFSISLWMRTSQSSALIVDHRPNNDGVYKGYSIELNSGQIIGRIRDGSAHDVPVFSTSTLNDGNFHNIVFVVNRGTHVEKLYVDNSLQASASIASVGNIDASSNLLLGGQALPNTPVDFFNGTLDEVSICNIPLKPGQINYLFLNGH